MKKLIFLAVIAALVMGGFKIYHSLQKGGVAADVVVAEFHELLNAGKYAEIYEKGAAGLHAAGKVDGFQKFLGDMKADLGSFRHGARQGINVSSVNGNTTLTVGCASTFEKARAEEKFVFDYNSDKPLLLRYDIKKLMGSATNAP